jgi:hypothetical protein
MIAQALGHLNDHTVLTMYFRGESLHGRDPALPLSTRQKKTLGGKNEQNINVNILGLPIGLPPPPLGRIGPHHQYA